MFPLLILSSVSDRRTEDVLDRRTKEQKNKSHKVKYVLLFFCLKIVPRQNYQVICLSRPNAVHLQRM